MRRWGFGLYMGMETPRSRACAGGKRLEALLSGRAVLRWALSGADASLWEQTAQNTERDALATASLFFCNALCLVCNDADRATHATCVTRWRCPICPPEYPCAFPRYPPRSGPGSLGTPSAFLSSLILLGGVSGPLP